MVCKDYKIEHKKTKDVANSLISKCLTFSKVQIQHLDLREHLRSFKILLRLTREQIMICLDYFHFSSLEG